MNDVLNSHKTVKYLFNLSNKYNDKDASFLFKIGWSCDIKRLSLIFEWNSELLEASTFKSPKETGWLHISMWSLMAVHFFDLHRLFVKGEIPECSPTLTLK